MMDRLRDFICEVVGCNPSVLGSENTALRDLDGWDSLKHVMFVIGLEKNFQTKLTAEEIQAMVTIADVAKILKDKNINV